MGGGGAGIYCYFLEGANDALSEYMNFIVCTSLRGANFTHQSKKVLFCCTTKEVFKIKYERCLFKIEFTKNNLFGRRHNGAKRTQYIRTG